MTRLLIDTDIGDDADDALALALAAKCPTAELLGVTTVYKNTRARARIAAALLAALGRPDVPVAAGEGVPLGGEPCAQVPPQYAAAQYAAARDFSPFTAKEAAHELILRAARSPGAQGAPGAQDAPVTVVCLGALTNLARCVREDAEAMRGVRVVVMGGMVTRPFPEGNIAADPEAARQVFSAGLDLTMVGLDVTLRCTLEPAAAGRLRASGDPGHRMLAEIIRLWKQNTLAPLLASWGGEVPGGDPACGMHDPMAVACALEPGLFRTRPARILIETKGEYTRGVTVEEYNVFSGRGGEPNAAVAEDVDVPAFRRLFDACVLPQ